MFVLGLAAATLAGVVAFVALRGGRGKPLCKLSHALGVSSAWAGCIPDQDPYCPSGCCMGTTRYDVPTGCAWQGGQCRATGYDQTTLTCTSGCLKTSVACGVVNGQCQLVPHNVTCCTNLPTPTPPPPPRLTLEFQCATWGLGGWCRGDGALKATGVDPSGGQVTVNGTLGDPAQTAIHCQGTPSCTTTVPLPEGQGTAEVTAVSRYGQAQGSQRWQYDPTPPEMTFALAPAAPNGANGWYVTSPTITLQGRDATSGIAALRISPDGGATWYPSPWTVPEGQFNLLMQAVDGAGNITQAQTQVRVDVTPPEVQTVVPPPDGAEGWHLTPVTVQVSGSDAVSGVAAAQVSVDGGAWQNDAATLSADGIHTVRFLVRDAAGNTASAGPEAVKVDVSPPQTVWGPAWQVPLGCVGVLSGQEEDGAGSGVAGAALSWDDGQTWQALSLDAQGRWEIVLDPRSLADGAHQARLRVWDVAGHQAEAEQDFTVAPPAPHIVVAPLGTDARWNFWETLRYEVRTTCLPIAKMRIVVEGPHVNRTVTWDTHTWPAPAADGSSPAVYAVTWRWDTRWDGGAYAHPGEYPVRFEAWDVWGRKWVEYGTLVVPVMNGPTPTLAPLPAATATPTAGPATPTATALAAGFVLPTARPTSTQGPTPTAWLRPATATPLPPAAPVARHTGLTGHAPPWAKTVAVGVLFAGIVAALAAAYYRRKLAAWRARLMAYLTAKKQAEARAQAEVEAAAPPPEPYPPPPGSPEAALLEGEIIDPHAAAEAKRRLKLVAQTEPQKQVRRWGAGHVLATMSARIITFPSACTQSLLNNAVERDWYCISGYGDWCGSRRSSVGCEWRIATCPNSPLDQKEKVRRPLVFPLFTS